jgi:hypothetical protein
LSVGPDLVRQGTELGHGERVRATCRVTITSQIKERIPQMEIVAVFKRIPKNQLTRHTTLFSLRSVP